VFVRTVYRGENRYDFRPLWRWGVRISAALVLLSVVALFTRGLNLGIDFRGGVSWEVRSADLTVEETRDALGRFGLADAKIQTVGSDIVRVQASAEALDDQNAVRQALGDLAGTDVGQVSVAEVGPTWGGEVTQAAIRALAVLLVAILGYVTLTFRGEWKMAVGVVVAVVHDVLISVGVYAVFQFEVTPGTVVAFLTILGYSIYDTVVVYDKVQENAGRVGVTQRLTYSEMVSLSLNQVLMRSINTSVISLLPVISLLVVGSGIFGAVVLGEFGIALLVGLGVGTYSSIFVAAPVLVALKEREPRYRALNERLEGMRARDEGASVGVAYAARSESADDEAEATPVGARAGGAEAVPTLTPPAGGWNHPPRPRKKGKRR
jgi:preprotein translocase subunit SecF